MFTRSEQDKGNVGKKCRQKVKVSPIFRPKFPLIAKNK